MLDSRRYFLKNLAGVSGSFLLAQSSPPIPKPRRKIPVDPPAPAEPQETDPKSSPKSLRRVQLETQEKEFRATTIQLFTKVSDLKDQLETLHTSDIFSVAIYRQTQEIEKLAKRLKTYARS